MNKKIMIFLLMLFSVSIYAKSNLNINKIELYGTFISPEYIKNGYHIGNGNSFKTKLPALIEDWPAADKFDQPPEVIIIIGYFQNNGNISLEEEGIEISIRMKVSKIIYNKNNEMDIEKSEKKKYWDKVIMNRKVEIDKIKEKSNRKKELLRFNIYDLISNYNSNGLNPWLCEITVTNNAGLKFVKTFEIGIVW